MSTSFFDQVYQKLFPTKDSTTSQGVLMHEVISRNDTYKLQYESWKKSYRLMDAVEKVKEALAAKIDGKELIPPVHLLQSNHSNGFAISFHKDFLSKEEFQYLFDWLAEKAGELDYYKANSDCLMTEKENHVETKEKHYLKPNQKSGDGKLFNQYFGNILIEYIQVDDKPSFIRLVANIYSDRQYKKAYKFDLLAKYLLNIA